MSEQPEYKIGVVYPLNIDELTPNPEQVRKYFDEESIAALAASIEEDGLLQNISFTENEGKLIIVAGERRVRALKHLREQGKEVPLFGKYVEGSLRKLAFVENLFREDMTAVEYAESVLALKDTGEELSQGALGQLLGLKRTTINGILSIAKMPDTLKDKVRDNPLVTRDTLEKISRIKGEGRQQKAIEDLLRELKLKEKGQYITYPREAFRTRGEIIANSISEYTKNLGTFTIGENPVRISPENRKLITIKLKELQSKIQKILDTMDQEKANWDKQYTENQKKKQIKKSEGKKTKEKPKKSGITLNPTEI